MTRIDHIELFVPERWQAAKWYQQVLGLEIIPEYEHWASDPRGPLMISSDGGDTKLALFEGTPQGSRETAGFHLVAFRMDAESFVRFLHGIDRLELTNHRGQRVTAAMVSDHTAAWSIYFNDPYGHRLEVTSYENEQVKLGLPS